MDALTGLLTGEGFLTGAAAGLIASGVAFAFRRRRVDWALLWTVGALAVMWSLRLLRGVGGGAPRGAGTSAVVILAGLVVAALAAYGIWRLSEFETGAIAVAISLAGIWVTVPDTERAAVLIGVTAILVLAWWPLGWSVPRGFGAIAMAAVAVWVVITDGAARDTGLIGGMGSLASLAWSALATPATKPWIWLGGHAVIVVVWSRWAGLLESPIVALAIGLTASVAVSLLVRVASPAVRPRET